MDDSLDADGGKGSRFACLCELGWWLRVVAVVISAVILWSVFPPARMGSDGAWFALVPLLLVIRHTAPRRAFWLGLLGGTVFWLFSLVWLWRLIWNNGPWPLVIFGHVALSGYCALYTALFARTAAQIWQVVHRHENLGTRLLAVLVAEPLLWVGAEYLRCVLLTGFPWHALGVSQLDSPCVIQVASLGGVYAVSLLVLLVNSAAASLVERLYGMVRDRRTRETTLEDRLRGVETFVPLLLLVGAMVWGQQRVLRWLRQADDPRAVSTWQVALVQPNAPCIFESDDNSAETVRKSLLEMTATAALLSKEPPDLVVWPETALIQSLPYERFAANLASNGAVAARAPLLAGAVEYYPGLAPDNRGARFYNSAWLIHTNGSVSGCYRKQHLVPFGEYIPGDQILPVLERLSPVGFSCRAGKESTLLHVSRGGRGEGRLGDELTFSPLICFEDTVAKLARNAVRKGARLLVNLTNDAWFNGSVEPEQHMAQAVFRCVETGVPMVRCANTGVSCAIDPVGHVQALESCQGRLSGFAGILPCAVQVPLQPLDAPYRGWGDWILAIPAALFLLVMLLVPVVGLYWGSMVFYCRMRRDRRRGADGNETRL